MKPERADAWQNIRARVTSKFHYCCQPESDTRGGSFLCCLRRLQVVESGAGEARLRSENRSPDWIRRATPTVAQIATQRQIVANRYLAFFQERRSIEATYIDSLRKLHRKAKTVDASSDPRAEPTTTRAAWDKLRDNLEKEANTQQAFVDILENDVIKPLESLKETKAQRGKQIEEDLKESSAKYADYAENTVSKLQEAYSKKSHPQHSTDLPRRSQGTTNKGFGRGLSALFRRREDSRAPEPAKSEEVSDDDCRRAIRLLNGLRLNRAEILKDGYHCLEDLVFTTTVKNALAKYMDGMVVACVKYDNLAMSTRAEVEKALAGTDTSGLAASFRHSLSRLPFHFYSSTRSVLPPYLLELFKLLPNH
ncbi:hypothetical protein EDB89DRAFT_2246716 [Lactarius sanguifluus]|nr:hypothetical protein EDB89DRAFT_2246716 [Lactarius sanguifluus]